MAKFEFGKVVVSDGIKQRLTQSDSNHTRVFINTSLGRFVIITEADRSVTTILFPSEY